MKTHLKLVECILSGTVVVSFTSPQQDVQDNYHTFGGLSVDWIALCAMNHCGTVEGHELGLGRRKNERMSVDLHSSRTSY